MFELKEMKLGVKKYETIIPTFEYNFTHLKDDLANNQNTMELKNMTDE